jgi:hypothetical protein
VRTTANSSLVVIQLTGLRSQLFLHGAAELVILLGGCAGFPFRASSRGSRLGEGRRVNQRSLDGAFYGSGEVVRRVIVGGICLASQRSQVQISDAQKDGSFVF